MLKSTQTHAFSSYMRRVVAEQPSINIEESYKKVLLSHPWNYSFEDMLVYDDKL